MPRLPPPVTPEASRRAADVAPTNTPEPEQDSPARRPTGLPLPLPVVLDDFSVGLLQWAGPPAFEARAIAEFMAEKPDVTVTYQPALIRIDGRGRLVFKMDEIGEYLGRDMTAEIFEVNTSTHYGRMVRQDDNTVILFANMDDVFEYI